MTADDLANSLVNGGATWLVLSLAAVLPILWAFTLFLWFARPDVLRFLQTLTLRSARCLVALLRPFPGPAAAPDVRPAAPSS